MYFSRYPLVGFMQFLYKHYKGFTIYHIPIFRPPQFFWQAVSEKNFIFRSFERAKGLFLSPVFTGSLEMLMFSEYSMTHFSFKRRAVMFFCKKIFFGFGLLLSKKGGNLLNFFETDLTFVMAHCVSSLGR